MLQEFGTALTTALGVSADTIVPKYSACSDLSVRAIVAFDALWKPSPDTLFTSDSGESFSY